MNTFSNSLIQQQLMYFPTTPYVDAVGSFVTNSSHIRIRPRELGNIDAVYPNRYLKAVYVASNMLQKHVAPRFHSDMLSQQVGL